MEDCNEAESASCEKSENTRHRENHHCMTRLQFDWFGCSSFNSYLQEITYLLAWSNPVQ